MFSPHYRWAKVPAAEVQAAQRRCFARRGCPQRVRLDNGIPWGNSSGLPSELGLWLAGLGVGVHWNDPYCPQQNGVVESTPGTSQRWVEPAKCGNIEELRAVLRREDRNYNERYPALKGLSRWQAYPALLHSGRGYTPEWEKQVWDLDGALQFLARVRVRRLVSKRGQVSLYHRLVQVGAAYGGCWLYVQMDPPNLEWVIRDVEGKELRRRPAPQFTAEAIIRLNVARP
jgi:hypothetical protein